MAPSDLISSSSHRVSRAQQYSPSNHQKLKTADGVPAKLEYMVPFLYTGEADPERSESRAIDRVANPPNGYGNTQADDAIIHNVIYDRVHKTLTSAGLPAEPMAAQPEGAPPVLPTQWDTVRDESLMESEEMTDLYDNRIVPLEVRSPVLPTDRHGFRFAKLAVDSLLSRHRLFVTDSCGYHVHVGCGTQGFSLSVLKKIAAFLWVFERQLGSLHPMERHRNGYAVSMREKANISRYASNLREGIRAIYAVTTARKLVHLIHWTDEFEEFESDDVFIRNMAYNFVNIVHAEGKKTIEFRQFCGTTDSLDVKMWAEVCVGIVMASSAAQEGGWLNFLHNAATMEENSPRQAIKIGPLLRRIGMADQANWAQHRSNSLSFGGICWTQ